jgi:hypothetical protein
MAVVITNRGLKLLLQWALQDVSAPSTFYAILLPSGATVNVDVNTVSDTSEIPAGNGYTSGGVAVARSNLGFIDLTEDDTNNWATIEVKNTEFTTSGGAIPTSGDIRYMAITTDEAAVADRQILFVFDLGSSITIPDGKYLNVKDGIIKLAHP